MKKNFIIAFLVVTNIIFGLAGYLQKIRGDKQVELAERYHVQALAQAKRAVEFETIALRNAEEAQKQRMIAEHHLTIVTQHLRQAENKRGNN